VAAQVAGARSRLRGRRSGEALSAGRPAIPAEPRAR